MTQTAEEFEKFPTVWRDVDQEYGWQVRQTSLDTWQLRSRTHVVTIDTEGFNLFRSGNEAVWEKYLTDNSITPVHRADFHD